MQDTAINATYFGGCMELNIHNFGWISTNTSRHVQQSRRAAVHEPSSFVSYFRRQTDHWLSGILMVGFASLNSPDSNLSLHRKLREPEQMDVLTP